MPQYLLSSLHAPGEIYLTQLYDWQDPSEWRFAYGNISSVSKILGCQRIGSPLTIGSWQLKRFNLRYSSFKSNSEGSFRMLCGDCSRFQVLAVKPSKYITSQGCTICIQKLNYVDTTMCVSNNFFASEITLKRLTSTKLTLTISGALPSLWPVFVQVYNGFTGSRSLFL